MPKYMYNRILDSKNVDQMFMETGACATMSATTAEAWWDEFYNLNETELWKEVRARMSARRVKRNLSQQYKPYITEHKFVALLALKEIRHKRFIRYQCCGDVR